MTALPRLDMEQSLVELTREWTRREILHRIMEDAKKTIITTILKEIVESPDDSKIHVP